MGRVKGSMLVDFVKNIRASKSGAYQDRLTDQDREVISGRIIPSAWYPFETYKNCFNAVVDVEAGGDMKKVTEWGRIYGEAIVTALYKGVIKTGNPCETLKRYDMFWPNFFDFGKVETTIDSDTEARMTIRDFDPDFEALYYMIRGWIERSVELAGGKNVEIVLLSRSWEGDPETSIRISWAL